MPAPGIERRTFIRNTLLAGASLLTSPCTPNEGQKLTPAATAKAKAQQPETKAIPRQETILSADKPPGASWAINLSENTTPPEPGQPKTPSAIPLENKVLIRHATGHIYAIDKEGKSLWKFETPGALLAADQDVAILTTPDNKLHILNSKSGRNTSQPLNPEAPQATPQDRLAKYWKPQVFTNKEHVLVQYNRTIQGTLEGFHLLKKSNGQTILKNHPGTHERAIDLLDDIVVTEATTTESEQGILIRKISTNEVVDTIRIPPTQDQGPKWVYGKGAGLFAVITRTGSTVGERAAGGVPATESMLTLFSSTTGTRVYEAFFAPGWHDQVYGRNFYTCIKYCNAPFTRVYITSPPKPLSTQGPEIIILAEAPLGSEGYGYSQFFPGERSSSPGDFFGVSPSRPEIWSDEKTFITSNSIRQTVYTQRSPGERPREYGRGEEGQEIGITLIETDQQGKITTTYERYRNSEASSYIGRVEENFIFANWDEKTGQKPKGNLKLLAFNPKQNRHNPVWTKDLETTKPTRVVITASTIYVVSESLLKIDAQTGISPPPLAFLGANLTPRQVHNLGDRLIVETTDNRLIAYPIQ